MEVVGTYKEKYNQILNLNLPIGSIYKSEGLFKHIQKRHPGYEKYLLDLPNIINNPDFLGNNPKEPNSIEFIKAFPDDNIQVAVKLDIKDNYLYVASLYDVSSAKVSSRLNSGRIKRNV